MYVVHWWEVYRNSVKFRTLKGEGFQICEMEQYYSLLRMTFVLIVYVYLVFLVGRNCKNEDCDQCLLIYQL